jgi:hypothetical protein
MSKVKRSLKLADFHRSYKIRCREKKMTATEYKKYRKIILMMGDVMSEILLNKGIIGMPWHIGDIFLKKTLPKGGWPSVIDMNKSKEQKQQIFNFNEHTDGFIYLPFWMSPERKGKKRKQWCFSAYRGTKRAMAKKLINKEVVYPDFAMMMKQRPEMINK